MANVVPVVTIRQRTTLDVDSTVPAETSVAYPDSVLLFVHEGDLVRVYEYPAT